MGATNKTYAPPYAGADEVVAGAANAAVVKALQSPGRLFLLGIMAGILIGIGFWFADTVASAFTVKSIVGLESGKLVTELYTSDPRQVALLKLLLGAVFPIGLIAILIGGAELWTGNAHVIPYGLKLRKFGIKTLLYNWLIVYAGNWVGSVFLAFMASLGTALLLGKPFADLVIIIAYKKVHLTAWNAFWRGIGCNFLVNLAVWLWLRAKKGDFMGQAFLIWFPIFAFVTMGFEHCIANMFAIPLGMMVSAANLKVVAITYQQFFFNNLIPVTLGNLIGGYVFIALFYWYVGFSKASKYGEATPTDALKYLALVLLAGAVLIVVDVIIPGVIATAIEKAAGLGLGASVSNPYAVLVPAIIPMAFYIILPFILYKVLNPIKDYLSHA